MFMPWFNNPSPANHYCIPVLTLFDLCSAVKKKILKEIKQFLFYDFYGHKLTQEQLPKGS